MQQQVAESGTRIGVGPYYAILPNNGKNTVEKYRNERAARLVEDGFSYNSGSNPDFLSVEQIRKLIRDQIDPGFVPV